MFECFGLWVIDMTKFVDVGSNFCTLKYSGVLSTVVLSNADGSSKING